MTGLVTTFQLALPRGPHEAVLDGFAEIFGTAERRLHVLLSRLPDRAHCGAQALKEAKNALKRQMIADEGLTARHYNSVLTLVEGRHDSLREICKARIATLKQKLKRLEKKLADRQRKIDAFSAARREAAARLARGKPLTKSLAAKLSQTFDPTRERFTQHQQKRRRQILLDRIDQETAQLARPVPSVVFGSKALLRQRARLHNNDLRGLRDWQRKWATSRSGQLLFVGSSDETAGCQSCVATLGEAGDLTLRIRLPQSLADEGKYLLIPNVALPDYARAAVQDALARHAAKDGRGPAMTWRFIKEIGHSEARRHSAWRAAVTLTVPAPAIERPSYVLRETGKAPSTPIALTPTYRGAIGVDLNADHIAYAAIDRHGNPLRRLISGHSAAGRINLPLRGASSDRRDAIIGDAVRDLITLARDLDLPLVIESLDFSDRKAEMQRGEAAYNRMLSSFAWAKIQSAIRRRAAREGVELVEVNPAYTSIIGRTNYARRYGLSVHMSAAVAIARRAARHSERINYFHGPRGRRSTLPSQSESRRHVWRHWSNALSAMIKEQWNYRRHTADFLPSIASTQRVRSGCRATDARSGGGSSG